MDEINETTEKKNNPYRYTFQMIQIMFFVGVICMFLAGLVFKGNEIAVKWTWNALAIAMVFMIFVTIIRIIVANYKGGNKKEREGAEMQ